MRISIFSVVALGLLTASCGSNDTQRAATGGLTGVGAGALIGGPVGAVVGGVVGAAGGTAMPEGADTMAEQALNKERGSGRTALSHAGLAPGPAASSGSSEPPAQTASSAEVKGAQQELTKEGLYHGKIDGIAGAGTKQAVTAFQQREGLRQTATLDRETLDKLNTMRSANQQPNQPAASAAAPAQAALSPSDLRQRLGQDGYTNIKDLTRQSNDTWTAEAQRGGHTLALNIDGKTGRVTHEQQVAEATPPAGGSSGDSTNADPAPSNAAPTSSAPSPAGNSAPSNAPPPAPPNH
jgi:peptidoglycan hydrolase-like protein with peptidoglycan-binding domain